MQRRWLAQWSDLGRDELESLELSRLLVLQQIEDLRVSTLQTGLLIVVRGSGLKRSKGGRNRQTDRGTTRRLLRSDAIAAVAACDVSLRCASLLRRLPPPPVRVPSMSQRCICVVC